MKSRIFRCFKSKMNLFCKFFSQVMFFMSVFGYMNILMTLKWFKYDSTNSGYAPSILITLINMFMANYPEEPCYVALMYEGQKGYLKYIHSVKNKLTRFIQLR